MKMFFSRLSVLFYTLILTVVCAGSATAAPIAVAGSDYFKIAAGTIFDFDMLDQPFKGD